ncbi:undecaprenyl-diphosphatase [Halobacillus karajensis]|uniref:PAP2 (Acid phosphatase) superfamily protein n=1 Tax=Halobacillus karajensis TaxID=195088 RepID=A0A024P711_9BACI|nr:phosphatase PAP2 family protein [Halobacillus karajensis]CDQ20409.1 PAP2 (acid phosphatase) superfamily protein [Halobacillus karajensis]CDQ24122.1 PAP2 (acid phosphatase) superfamily protein [Halobacillus karajensis]CDQ27600.1 PAP2 (acid phosphatase) superfamily protein [Halobacillus karajensis]SEH92111.1 undecaprenyl-diphosphatase [Halobacillus karajensis]
MLFSGTKLSDLSKVSILIILAGFGIVGGAVYLFIELAAEILEKEKFLIDQAAMDVVTKMSAPWLDTFWGWTTDLGSVPFITLASIILLIYLLLLSSYSRWVGIYFSIAMLGISALTKLLKVTFERQRPEVLAEFDGTGFSFPSGHSTGSIVFYGFVIYLIVISPLQKKWKWLINLLLGLLIAMIGLSRVYLSVHYFTDIVAGFLFGLAWLFVSIFALEITLWNQRRRQSR